MRPRPFTPTIVWYVAVVHSLWMVGLLLDPRAQWITPLALFATVVPSWGMASLLCATLLCTGLGLRSCRQCWRLTGILPTMVVLWISAANALVAVWMSAYGDGVLRPRWFIGMDQAATILLPVWYAASCLRQYALVRRYP